MNVFTKNTDNNYSFKTSYNSKITIKPLFFFNRTDFDVITTLSK
jgi:hypothetical protein